jgi:hypothetical protein
MRAAVGMGLIALSLLMWSPAAAASSCHKCNPSSGTDPNGDQIFAVRPDGTGLRQLTSLGGVQTLADGTLLVELPGAANYSAPVP